jgi:hypothetical protein
MTALVVAFRPQILLLVSLVSVSCRGDDGLGAEGPGFGGSGGSGGGGSGGGAPTDAGSTFFADRAPDLTPDTPVVQPMPPDAALPQDTALPRDTAPPPDTAGPVPDAPPADRPPDAAPPPPPPPDSAPPPPPPPLPDAAPIDPNAIIPSTCEQIPCQDLFIAAASCNSDAQMCQSQVTAMDPVARTNYCHVNGVKKLAATTFSGDGYTTVMRVNRADGSHCYTLEMSGAISSDVETQVWKSPTGAVLITGAWTKSIDRRVLSCNGMSYDTREVGCPGLDGEPSTDIQCPPGVCPD